MRSSYGLLTASIAFFIASSAVADPPAPAADNSADQNKKGLVFNTNEFRPQIVLHETPHSTSAAFVTVSGVIFSRSPIDHVEVGSRTATLRDVEPKDLVKIERMREGASDAPVKTYFEVPDVGLSKIGVNDVEIRAHGADGRVSDLHRITVVRTLK